jgi:hypothetical protein
MSIPESAEKKAQVTGSLLVKMVRGVPFQAKVGYQRSESIEWQIQGFDSVRIESNQTLVQGGGWLLAPMSWQGLMGIQGRGLHLRESGLSFDRFGGNVLLQAGLLQAPDVRILGDQVSLLGNGWVNRSDGAGVLRVVVPTTAAGMVTQRLEGASLQPLEPGNRGYIDLSVWREPEGWVAGYDDRTLPVAELLSGRPADGR